MPSIDSAIERAALTAGFLLLGTILAMQGPKAGRQGEKVLMAVLSLAAYFVAALLVR